MAAWLPGSEGKGLADVLFKKANGKINYPFSGTLSFSWPNVPCLSGQLFNTPNERLFSLGYGLKYGAKSMMKKLDVDTETTSCSKASSLAIFTAADHVSYPLVVTSGTHKVTLGADTFKDNAALEVTVKSLQFDTHTEAKRVSWSDLGRFEAQAAFGS